ncbi:Ov2 [Ovine gammaherpesvirus 2]|uniref:Ov2 n=1 Tax=Ovine gammaherpesvirus 2 TaxID=10398 RepID=A1BLZ2_9GAMA|nr:Ov2 [Ovine gammaherpesvirus 2]
MSDNKKPEKKTYPRMCDLTEEQRERRRSTNRRASRNFKKRLQEHEQQQERELRDLTYTNMCLRGEIEKKKEEIRRLQYWLSTHNCLKLEGATPSNSSSGGHGGEVTNDFYNSEQHLWSPQVGGSGCCFDPLAGSTWQMEDRGEGTASSSSPFTGEGSEQFLEELCPETWLSVDISFDTELNMLHSL